LIDRFRKNDLIIVGPLIIDGFIKGDNPDVICHALKFCSDDPGQAKCRIYPSNSSLPVPQRALNLLQQHPLINSFLIEAKICDIPGIKEICQIINNVFNNHMPLVDLDRDRFGTEVTLRGSSWRGKDCDDISSKVHPGAHVVDGDWATDSNCNGILGMDSTSGKSWEEVFCNETQRLGIAVLGDSISAHFHIPEEWLDAREFSVATFEHLGFILENELDWPEMSGTTGHINVTWPNIVGK
jgi:acyloxyacyl hydrolase